MIKTKESGTADSRVAKEGTDKEALLKSSMRHIGDIQKVLARFAAKPIEGCVIHDLTLLSGIDEFYNIFPYKKIKTEVSEKVRILISTFRLTDTIPQPTSVLILF